jgi:hypothetical protein
MLSLVLADRRISQLSILQGHGMLGDLQTQFLGDEVTRIHVSSAVMLRILDDNNDGLIAFRRSCGKLQEDRSKARRIDLTLREACNKIIHARDVNWDVVRQQDLDAYIRPFVYLYGSKGKLKWRTKLNLVDYVRHGLHAISSAII